MASGGSIEMKEVFWDAFKDTLALIPWLFGIHVVLEMFTKRTEDFLAEKISHRRGLAPFLGAILGCMPQCGFSVIAATLYARRCISLGTLLAVFLSTSDEALPIMLSQYAKAPFILWFILLKVVIATLAGYMIDLCHRPSTNEVHLPHAPVIPCVGHQHCSCHTHQGEEPRWKTFLLFPLQHTMRISFYIFLVCLGINALLEWAGPEILKRFFFTGTLLQPIIAVLIGLIPNCAASVVITETYLQGGINFSSAIAGLSASAGLGLVVLFKENRNPKSNLIILGLLAGISLLAGWILNLFQSS